MDMSIDRHSVSASSPSSTALQRKQCSISIRSSSTKASTSIHLHPHLSANRDHYTLNGAPCRLDRMIHWVSQSLILRISRLADQKESCQTHRGEPSEGASWLIIDRVVNKNIKWQLFHGHDVLDARPSFTNTRRNVGKVAVWNLKTVLREIGFCWRSLYLGRYWLQRRQTVYQHFNFFCWFHWNESQSMCAILGMHQV